MRIATVAAAILLLVLCVVPVARVLGYSLVTDDGGLTLENYREAFAPPWRLGILLHSLSLAALAALLALLIGVPYAFFCTRVRTPGRGFFSAVYILPLVLPPLLMTMGWTQFLRAAFGESGESAEWLLGGVRGAAFLFALSYWPFVVLFARKGFLEIGAGLEEAARVSTGPFRAFFRITLRLAAPGILAGALFVFLFSLSDFSVVDYLSTIYPPKERVTAYTFEAFSAWATNWVRRAGPREAAALCVPVGVASLVLLLLILRLHGRARLLSVTSGHVRARDVEELSRPAVRWTLRIAGFLFLTAVLALSVGVPLGRTLREAAGPAGPEPTLLSRLAGDGRRLVENVRFALVPGEGGSVGALPDVLNSLAFSLAAAAGMTVLALVLARHAVRRGPRREALLLSLAFLPLAFGSILYGVGLIRTWNQPWLQFDGMNPVYDTWIIVVLMLVGKYLPFALAAVLTTLRRIDPRFEEAGAVAGARPLRRTAAVTVPLARGGLAGAFILGFVFSMRELDTIVLISAGNRTAMMKIYTWVHTAYESSVAALSLVLTLVIALPFLLHWILLARRVRVL